MARKQSNINGMIHASDDVEGWSIKVPATSVNSVISTLQYAQTLPPQVDADKRGKKALRPKISARVASAEVAEAPKRRGRPRKDANAAPKPESTKPKMADILASIAAKGPVTYESASAELIAHGHRAGAIANFLKSKTFDNQGHYVEAN